MSEGNVLASCLKSREAFDQVMKLDGHSDFGDQGRIVLDHIEKFYSNDPEAKFCDPDIVARSIGRSLSNPKHKETFDRIVLNLADSEVSPANVVQDMLGVRMDALGDQLASALAARRSRDEVVSLMQDYLDFAKDGGSAASTVEVYNAVSLDDLVRTKLNEEALIPVWPQALNDRLDGGMLPGHHMVIYARPEMGKTLMVINMIAGFLHHGKRVLYLGNEDPIKPDILLRVYTRLTERTKVEAMEDPEGSLEIAKSRGYDNLFLVDLAPGNPRQIEGLVEENQPDVVIIDQLRNLDMDDDNRTTALEKAAIFARNIAKKYNVFVVSVTQAGDSAAGKTVLDMGDIDGSNTGIPAQADVMVGIGGTQDDVNMDRRIISLPKNKRSGSHEFFPVQLVRTISKIQGATQL